MTSDTNIPKSFFIIDSTKIFPIKKSVTSIGRNWDNDLVLVPTQISRRHAEVHFSEGRFFIKDLNSTGGVFVNDKRVSKCDLAPGDVVMLANIPLVFGQKDFPASQKTSEYKDPPQQKPDRDKKPTDFLW